MVKQTWMMVLAGFVALGCSAPTDDPEQFSLDASAESPDSLGVAADGYPAYSGSPARSASVSDHGACGLPSQNSTLANEEECASPALPNFLNQPIVDVRQVHSTQNEELAVDPAESAELSPPSFVPPMTIASLSLPRNTSEDSEEQAPETTAESPAAGDVLLPRLPTPVAPSEPSALEPPHPFESAPAPIPVAPRAISGTAPGPGALQETGFLALIDHASPLSGWEVIDGKFAAWEGQAGILRCLGTGGGWLQTTREFGDFVLRGEYRLAAGSNTGIAVRYPGTGNPSLTGIEVQLLDESADKYADLLDVQRHGSLYYLVPVKFPSIPRPVGEWNEIEITCRGRDVSVRINGLLVNEATFGSRGSEPESSRLGTRAPRGRIALQSHDQGVEFRNLRLCELTQTTATGLQIVEIVPGEGEPVASGAFVTVHYVGQFTTGEVFDSSYEREYPVTLPLDQVIPGWREGLLGMRTGERRRLIVPPHLAYGEAGVEGVIPPQSTLIFEIELLSFTPGHSTESVSATLHAPESPTRSEREIEQTAAAHTGTSNRPEVELLPPPPEEGQDPTRFVAPPALHVPRGPQLGQPAAPGF